MLLTTPSGSHSAPVTPFSQPDLIFKKPIGLPAQPRKQQVQYYEDEKHTPRPQYSLSCVPIASTLVRGFFLAPGIQALSAPHFINGGRCPSRRCLPSFRKQVSVLNKEAFFSKTKLPFARKLRPCFDYAAATLGDRWGMFFLRFFFGGGGGVTRANA